MKEAENDVNERSNVKLLNKRHYIQVLNDLFFGKCVNLPRPPDVLFCFQSVVLFRNMEYGTKVSFL